MRVCVLFNPASGRGRGRANLERIRARLGAGGHEVDPIDFADALLDADWTRRLIGAGAFVVIGGDGTVNFAAGPAGDHGVPLYQFPMGTENLFAREFGMVADPEALLRAIELGDVQRLDTARILDTAGIDGAAFIIMASFGPDAGVIHRLHAARNGAIRHLSYARPILGELVRWTVTVHTVEADGESVVNETPSVVVVANCRQYGGRLDPARDACMSDGLLDVVILPYTTRLGLASWVGKLRRGAHLADGRCIVRRARRVRVTRHDGPICCQIDGEAFRPGETELRSVEIEIVPGRLPVLAPPAG